MSTMTLDELRSAIRAYQSPYYSTIPTEVTSGWIDAIDAHLAAREADAVPVAWMRRNITYVGVEFRRAGERVISEEKVYSDDIPLYAAPVAQEAAAPAEQVVATRMAWNYCPECGCEDRDDHPELKSLFCKRCGQEWFTDIDYTDVVRNKLYRLNAVMEAQGGVTEDVVRGAHERYLEVVREGIAMGVSHVSEDNQRKAMRAALLFAGAALAAHPHTGYSAVPED